ncbi:MAG: hypothetical protein R3246_09795 [Acidimicrobiia bacterium]|nr:hypothetical protein [Acidimicrobiia bacterium]
MRRFTLGLAIAALVGGMALPAAAGQQPTQVTNSSGRDGGASAPGPHCHVNLVASERSQGFDTIMTGAIHQGHVKTGLSGAIFAADPDCST